MSLMLRMETEVRISEVTVKVTQIIRCRGRIWIQVVRLQNS